MGKLPLAKIGWIILGTIVALVIYDNFIAGKAVKVPQEKKS